MTSDITTASSGARTTWLVCATYVSVVADRVPTDSGSDRSRQVVDVHATHSLRSSTQTSEALSEALEYDYLMAAMTSRVRVLTAYIPTTKQILYSLTSK